MASSEATASAHVSFRTRSEGRGGATTAYPHWFYLPAAIICGVLFLFPTFASLFFSLTRWTLFDWTFIGLGNFAQFFREPFLVQGLINTLIYGVVTSGMKVVLGLLLAVLLTSQIAARGYLRSVVFFPVLVSTIGVGITFTALMHPTQGVINETLELFGIDGPGWLTNPKLALLSVALVDVWKGVGLATVIYMAGLASIPQEYFEAARDRRGKRLSEFLERDASPLAPCHGDGDHPEPHRRASIVRPDLGDDARRPGLHVRRDGVGHLQAVPGRLLRAFDGRQRRPFRSGRRDHRSAVLFPEPERGEPMRPISRYAISIAAIVVSVIVFLVPFAFIVLTALKDRKEAGLREFSWPSTIHLWDNLAAVIKARDYMLLTAFMNSIILTVASVVLLVVFGAMVGFVLQRRPGPWTRYVNFLVLAGLIIPPAVVPTIWVLQSLGLFKTLHGLVLIEVAYGLSFSVLLFRAFIATIPRELDEAAIMDGAGPVRLFFQIILPLLRPVTVTVIVVQSVTIFNDFTNPLYYLPGQGQRHRPADAL